MRKRAEMAGAKEKKKVEGLGKFDDGFRGGQNVAETTIRRTGPSVEVEMKVREENFEEDVEEPSRDGEDCFRGSCGVEIVKS